MGANPKKRSAIILSVADEVKKVSYLGAAGPYLAFGDDAKTVVGGTSMVAIALVCFILCQVIAHGLMVLANTMEVQDD